jgi:hypothetical protein
VEVAEVALAAAVVAGEAEVPGDWAGAWWLLAIRARVAVKRLATGQALDDVLFCIRSFFFDVLVQGHIRNCGCTSSRTIPFGTKGPHDKSPSLRRSVNENTTAQRLRHPTDAWNRQILAIYQLLPPNHGFWTFNRAVLGDPLYPRAETALLASEQQILGI